MYICTFEHFIHHCHPQIFRELNEPCNGNRKNPPTDQVRNIDICGSKLPPDLCTRLEYGYELKTRMNLCMPHWFKDFIEIKKCLTTKCRN
jgi:hypothetical protein